MGFTEVHPAGIQAQPDRLDSGGKNAPTRPAVADKNDLPHRFLAVSGANGAKISRAAEETV
ncbi:MAG: hypothetical protein ACM359_20185 [Bacillota bacterium]